MDGVKRDHPNLDFSKPEDLNDILSGKIIGRKGWYDESLVVFNAKIEKLRKNKVYKIAYWLKDEEYHNAEDYKIPVIQLAADLLYGDFVFC